MNSYQLDQAIQQGIVVKQVFAQAAVGASRRLRHSKSIILSGANGKVPESNFAEDLSNNAVAHAAARILDSDHFNCNIEAFGNNLFPVNRQYDSYPGDDNCVAVAVCVSAETDS